MLFSNFTIEQLDKISI